MRLARAFLLIILIVQCYSTYNEPLQPDEGSHPSLAENSKTFANNHDNDQLVSPLEEGGNNVENQVQEKEREGSLKNPYIEGTYTLENIWVSGIMIIIKD